MSIIVTHNTDQHQAKYGYCSKCFKYNEVWRKAKSSTCDYCGSKMYHISDWKIWTAVLAAMLSLLIYLN